MKSTCCSTVISPARNIANKAADGETHPSSAKRRGLALAKFSLPTLILALLPKCPACFAAYIALTGVSVSVADASTLRWTLVAICVAALVAALASSFRAMPKQRLLSGHRLH
ncbi:MAG TPA: hypothetical protein VKV30_00910 [Candidatus Angelobacter sp.]|nr:hypothetical protein [Candidatus Angelobacter sp.]